MLLRPEQQGTQLEFPTQQRRIVERIETLQWAKDTSVMMMTMMMNPTGSANPVEGGLRKPLELAKAQRQLGKMASSSSSGFDGLEV